VALRPNLSIGLPFSVVVLFPQQNPFARLPKQHKTETTTVRFGHKLSQIGRWDYVQAAKAAVGFPDLGQVSGAPRNGRLTIYVQWCCGNRIPGIADSPECCFGKPITDCGKSY
jgi:hypothetical protein